MSSFVTFCSVFIVASSQCNWTVIDPNDGVVNLDLKPLHGVTLNITDRDNPTYHYTYTPCQNNVTCNGHNVMAVQTNPSVADTCYVLGRWNYSIQPWYYQGGYWGFYYDNGATNCRNYSSKPTRTWMPSFHCKPGVKYEVTQATQRPNSNCEYDIRIDTEYACPDWTTTTTTTSIPDDECIFKSEDGRHILNMASIRGELLSGTDTNTEYLYYMYTPCMNSANCNNNIVMAYLLDGINFECKQSLAIWENGFIEPNYIDSIEKWQFTYTNGQSCNGEQSVFNVEWFCDKTATSPRVIQTKEIATCVYQMVINSTLACG